MMNLPVRIFAAILPILAENSKLQNVNLAGNTLVDQNCDAYDLFDIDHFNMENFGEAAPKDVRGGNNGKAGNKKQNKQVDIVVPKGNGKKRKGLKVRYG